LPARAQRSTLGAGLKYVVQPGDTLTRIAAKFGFHEFRDVYDHPDNLDFRELRPDPNLLFPGDEVFIPPRPDPPTFRGPTDQRHRITLPVAKQTIRVSFHPAEDNPFEGLAYTLVAGLDTFEGAVQGTVEHQTAAEVEHATLTVHGVGEDARDVSWTLALGHLDPLDTLCGIQARLNNLGFACGEVDGIDGPKTQAGVRAFQRYVGIADDGIVGPVTRGELEKVYGC
jgi:Putative peptidoglycan binding domain/LysM domain